MGSHIEVSEILAPHGQTQIRLQVHGLQPDRAYGAHVHVRPCGASGTDAGGHYQNTPDPRSPSVDPRYANPANEVWLDLTTDAHGDATATSTVTWRFRPAGAGSVVLHAEHTHTAPGQAGVAGARLACLTVPFR